MENLTLKERFIYRFIFNERIVYRHWYGRFLTCRVHYERLLRVIARVKTFYDWCREWSKEGELLEKKADEAVNAGNRTLARHLYQEAVGCFHIAQHVYFINIAEKNRAQARARGNFVKAIALWDEVERPVRLDIPFRGTSIPGYLRLAGKPGRPLIIHLNGLDNIKEAENQYAGDMLVKAGFNFYTFDGPGQGEMWASMKMIPDYDKAVSTIIDWFETNNQWGINMKQIGVSGFSFGGYLAPAVAACERRISCAVGMGGLGYSTKKQPANILLLRVVQHVWGFSSLTEAMTDWEGFDIRRLPALDRPMLVIHGGKDVVVPEPRKQAEYIMDWARGEKELLWYPDGDHVCLNHFDEVMPYFTDWLTKHL